MLPKLQRLNLKKDFKYVASGKKIEGKYLKIFIRVGTNTSPRIGIATSTKVFKNASQRNRARRLTSAAFQTTNYQLPTTINIVALPKAAILLVKSSDVRKDVESSLKDYVKDSSQTN